MHTVYEICRTTDDGKHCAKCPSQSDAQIEPSLSEMRAPRGSSSVSQSVSGCQTDRQTAGCLFGLNSVPPAPSHACQCSLVKPFGQTPSASPSAESSVAIASGRWPICWCFTISLIGSSAAELPPQESCRAFCRLPYVRRSGEPCLRLYPPRYRCLLPPDCLVQPLRARSFYLRLGAQMEINQMTRCFWCNAELRRQKECGPCPAARSNGERHVWPQHGAS
jgi:hypothetical protein